MKQSVTAEDMLDAAFDFLGAIALIIFVFAILVILIVASDGSLT